MAGTNSQTLPVQVYSMLKSGVTPEINALCTLMLVAVFLAAFLGDLFTYCVTSVQLGIAHPSATGGAMASILEFAGIFAVTQIPLAVIEGLLTVVVMIGLKTYAKPELREIGYLTEGE